MTTKKTVIALVASLGLGLLPLALVTLSGCGDDKTDVYPYDGGTDAARPPDGGDGGGDAKPDTGPDAAKPDTGTPTEAGPDAPTDAPAG